MFSFYTHNSKLRITSLTYCPGKCSKSNISVAAGSPPYTYSWSTGSTTQDIVNVQGGIHEVIVTDSSGCVATASINIFGVLPSVESICLVSVDTLTGKNLITWEKTQTQGVKSYNIYKESTQAGTYYLIGNVPFDTLSEFLDTVSNPLQQAWRYKISVIDSCYNESTPSSEHKTMHLNILLDINNDISLIWDHYQGFTFFTYYLHRYTPSTGWVEFDSIANNLTSRTDFSPPGGNLSYRVVAKHPDGCTIDKSKNYNSSKSNSTSISLQSTLTASTSSNPDTSGNCVGNATVTVSAGTAPYTYLWNDVSAQTNATATNLCVGPYDVIVTDADGNTITVSVNVTLVSGVFIDDDLKHAVKIYPNPSQGVFTVELGELSATEGMINVYNILGNKILNFELQAHKSEIDLSKYSPGIYYLQVITDRGIANKKVVIE